MLPSLEQVPRRIAPHPLLDKYYSDISLREGFLSGLFDRTAFHYNWIGQVMSFGSGRWYRRKTLYQAGLLKGMRVLDVACGTGAVAQCATKIVGPSGSVVGLDASAGMLHEVRQGACAHRVQGRAERLPFSDASFDFVSMGYALRHVSDLRTAFLEYFRVLKPGGVLLILEISRPKAAVPYHLTRFYFKTVVPWMTFLGTGNAEVRTLMRYCWDTIDHCLPPEAILTAITEAGFSRASLSESLRGMIRDFAAVKP